MPDCSRACVVLVALTVAGPLAWAQQPPSLKQLLELDTQRAAQEKPASTAPRASRPAARPQVLAIYGPSGQRTVLVRLGAARVLFQENQPGSLPPSSYQLLGIQQHCASFRLTGSKAPHQACLIPAADPLSQPAPPRAPQAAAAPPSLPWPVKEAP